MAEGQIKEPASGNRPSDTASGQVLVPQMFPNGQGLPEELVGRCAQKAA